MKESTALDKLRAWLDEQSATRQAATAEAGAVEIADPCCFAGQAELAKEIGDTDRTIRNWMDDGTLPLKKDGTVWIASKSRVEALKLKHGE